MSAINTNVLENIRIDAGARGQFTGNFKKSFWGLGKKEVDEYINNLTQSLKKAEHTFEEKLSELQNNLNLVTKERDSLSAIAEGINKKELEYKNYIKKLNEQLNEQKEKANSLSGLEEKYLNLVEEYKKIREYAKSYEDIQTVNSEIVSKGEVIESENAKLSEKNQVLQAKVKELIDENLDMQKKHQLLYKELKIDIHQQLSKDKFVVERLKQQINELSEAVNSLNLTVEFK